MTELGGQLCAINSLCAIVSISKQPPATIGLLTLSKTTFSLTKREVFAYSSYRFQAGAAPNWNVSVKSFNRSGETQKGLQPGSGLAFGH
jgi:hypothetical protein